MALKYSKDYEINYYDVDSNLKCKLSSLVNFFCDIGNAQTEYLGETIDDLLAKNVAWVFYKYDIKIYEYPKYRDKIKVQTIPAAFNKFYAYRRYSVFNEEGKLLAEGIALFFMIDINRRRPTRISHEHMKLYDAEDVNGLKIDMDDLMCIESEDISKEFNVRYSDIDSNGHVNNVKYIEWAIESVPVDVVKEYQLERVKVIFEKETTYGNKVNVVSQILNQDNNRIHTLHTIKDNNVVFTKLELIWGRD